MNTILTPRNQFKTKKITETIGLWGTAQNNAVTFGLDRIKKVFEGAEAIGGGCGLGQIRPYFSKGLYREEKNPFIRNLPEDKEIDKVIESGKSEDIR